jgi:NADH-quinone oxidoreductase subunit N
MLSWDDIATLSPELFLAVAGMALLLKGAFCGQKAAKMIGWAAVGCFLIAAVLLGRLDWTHGPVMNGMFTLDRFGGFMAMLSLLIMAANVTLAIRSLEQDRLISTEYFVLNVFAALGIIMMISASNMLSLYLSLELQSLSIYVLAAIRKNNTQSSEAGLKYFILGALASGMLLFGISLVYGFSGSIDFAGIDAAMRASATHTMPMIVGLVFILAGIAFKVSAVPFHMWTPDVYVGAPTTVTTLMATVPKIGAIAMMMRMLFGPFGSIVNEWQQIVWFLSAASMIWSSFAALNQTNIKRLMAYSSIGNMGYALVGIAAATKDGAGSVLIYMAIYVVMTMGVFAVIQSMRRDGLAVENISDLAGLSRTRPGRAYAMAILMFSLSGVPPMAGFFGKLVVFQAATGAGLYWLAVIGVVMSVVATYYYLKIVKVMFFDEAAPAFDATRSVGNRIVLAVSVALVLLFVISPNALVESGRASAAVLFHE